MKGEQKVDRSFFSPAGTVLIGTETRVSGDASEARERERATSGPAQIKAELRQVQVCESQQEVLPCCFLFFLNR